MCEDVTDTGASQLGSEVTDDDDSRSVSELGNMLKKDFAMIHTLSREEIQVTDGRLFRDVESRVIYCLGG